MYFFICSGLCKDRSWMEALEDKLVADAASEEVQVAQPGWVCQPDHLAPEMELVHRGVDNTTCLLKQW